MRHHFAQPTRVEVPLVTRPHSPGLKSFDQLTEHSFDAPPHLDQPQRPSALFAAGPTIRRQQSQSCSGQLLAQIRAPVVAIAANYTPLVKKLLDGKADVVRIPVNGGPTTNGLKFIDQWLGNGKWDVIHFNWGLHDVKWCDDNGTLTEVGVGHQQVPLDAYEKNLRQLLARLKKTGAKLIWCSTTPVPAKSKGRVQGDEIKYNEVAARMMRDEGVATDDLYRFALPQLAEIQVPADVHYTPAGYEKLAEQVLRSIESALRAK
jgi:lysophospholipase L1-like esterase